MRGLHFTSPRKGGERESNRVRRSISARIARIARSAAAAQSRRVVAADACMVRLFAAAGKGLMLFNSYPFIFLFLPVALIGYFALGRRRQSGAGDLAGAGLAGLLFRRQLAVRAAAAGLDRLQLRHRLSADRDGNCAPRRALPCSRLGVAGDLLVLGIFKYAGFLAANLNALFSTGFAVNILLPVGISFYTFTQIAFLVDAYRGNVARYALPHYALFVTYFPHLIAGPDPASQGHDPAIRARGGQAARSASDPVRPDHLRDRPVQEDLPRRRHPAAGRARLRRPTRRPSIRPGSARWPTRSSSISISPAIPTWRSASR